MIPELKEYIKTNLPKTGKALDLGCGDRTEVDELEKLGWNCDGVDIVTGTDLNEVYSSKNAPYDFIYSNYVIQKLNTPESLVKTIEENLRDGGKFFIHTFDESDEYANKKYSKEAIKKMFENSPLEIESCEKNEVFDEEPGHEHFHQILQVSGFKPESIDD